MDPRAPIWAQGSNLTPFPGLVAIPVVAVGSEGASRPRIPRAWRIYSGRSGPFLSQGIWAQERKIQDISATVYYASIITP